MISIRILRFILAATIIMVAGGIGRAQDVDIATDSDLHVKLRDYTPSQREKIYSTTAPFGIKYTKQHPLVIALNWMLPPFSYVNDEGRPDGLIVDLLHQLFSHFHVAHEIRMMDRADVHRQLVAGTAQLTVEIDNLPAMKGVWKGRSVLAECDVAVLRRNATPMLRSIMLLRDKDTVTVNKPSHTYYYLRDCFKDNVPFQLESIDYSDAVNQLLQKKIKYFIGDEVVLKNLVRKYGIEDQLKIERIDVPESNFRFFSCDTLLLHNLDRILLHMQATDQYQPILDKWLNGNPKHEHSDNTRITMFAVLAAAFIILVLVVLRTSFSHRLESEFRTIARMSIELAQCQLLVCNVRRRWIYNIAGTHMLRKGMSYGDYMSMVHPRDIGIIYEAVKQVDEGQTQLSVMHFRAQYPDDTSGAWRNIAAHPMVKCRKGKPVYVYLVIIDETERFKERKRLDLTLQENIDFTGRTDFGIACYDNHGYLVSANNAFYDIFNVDGQERAKEFLMNTRIRELCVKFNGLMLKRNIDVWFCAPLDIPELNLRKTVEVKIRTVERDMRAAKGYVIVISDIEEERLLRKNTAVIDAELKETKAKLEQYQSELRFLMAHNNMNSFRWRLGNDYFELSRDGIIYERKIAIKDYADSIADGGREEFLTAMQTPEKSFSHTVNVTRHLKQTAPEYKDQWFDIHILPDYNAEGNFIGFSGIRCDVTSYASTQQKLREETANAKNSGHQKTLFLASMTHELRTPLNAINGFAEIMSYPITEEEQQQYVGIMAHNCTMLLSLVDTILQMSKIDTEGIVIRNTEVDFAKVFRKKAEEMKKYIINPEVKYRIDTPYQSLVLNVDVEHIMHIFEAFVNNASKFTAQGFIHVGFRYDEDTLTIYCRDSGCGIPQDKQSIVFNRFVKLDEFMQGTGLGLSMVKAIADGMGATIDLYSREGEGTVISLNVNVSQTSPPPRISGSIQAWKTY